MVRIKTKKEFDDVIPLVKELINLYYTTIGRKNGGIEKAILSYYIIYGISNEIDDKIIQECFPKDKDWSIAKQTICNTKSSLKKEGIISYDDRKRAYFINSPLNLVIGNDMSIQYEVNYVFSRK